MKAACKWQKVHGNLAATIIVSGSIFCGSLLSGGCGLLDAPEPEPTPVPPPTPRPGVFVPDDYTAKESVPPPVRLNVPGDATKPSFYELVGVASDPAEHAILLGLRAVKVQTLDGKEVKSYGAPSLMRLAGIVAPVAGQAGGAEVIKTVTDWTVGQQLDVEQDKKYPTDLKDRPRVQVFFKGRAGEHKDKSLLLNRMMVRSGYAIVDIFAPTIFDNKGWLNDEAYARKQWNPLTKMPGLGLWAWTPSPLVVLGQRLPAPKPTSAVVTTTTTTTQRGGTVQRNGVKVNPGAIRNTGPANTKRP